MPSMYDKAEKKATSFPAPCKWTKEELEAMTPYRRALTTMSPDNLADEWVRVTTRLREVMGV